MVSVGVVHSVLDTYDCNEVIAVFNSGNALIFSQKSHLSIDLFKSTKHLWCSAHTSFELTQYQCQFSVQTQMSVSIAASRVFPVEIGKTTLPGPELWKHLECITQVSITPLPLLVIKLDIETEIWAKIRYILLYTLNLIYQRRDTQTLSCPADT